MLTNPDVQRSDLAEFLVQNGAEISDEDMSTIVDLDERNKRSLDIEEVPYTLSDDGQSFMTTDISDKLPNEIKETFVRIPTKMEARFLEDIYYQTQDRRICLEGQLRSLKQEADSKSNSEENNENNMLFMNWLLTKMKNMENNIKSALEVFSSSYYLSRWAKANVGIGPVISTVLAANLELKDGFHAGNWWSYMGVNNNNRPWLGKEKSKAIVEEILAKYNNVITDEVVAEIAVATKWSYSFLEKKAKNTKKKKNGWSKEELIKACSFIPYNKHMKVLAFKIGHSFRMVMNKESKYGKLLKEREAYEMQKNAAGDYAEQAAEILRTKNFKKSTVAYSYYIKGELPPTHIHQRAERWVTKLFISHLFEAAYYNKFGVRCPEPYIIGFDPSGHNDYIEPEVSYESIERDK
jgi:hypothetical protein